MRKTGNPDFASSYLSMFIKKIQIMPDPMRYSSTSYPWEIHSETPTVCLKLLIGPNPIYIVVFAYTNIPMIELNSQIRHRQRLTTITNNKI